MSRGMGTRGQSSPMGQKARDPRLDEVIRTLQGIGNLMGRQAQERAANIAQAAEAAAAAAINGNQANQGQAQIWIVFVEASKGKYFPESVQERKLAEFVRFHQGQMIVNQYEAKLARLSKFAPKMVKDPLDTARRFRDGLKPDLRSQMISLNLRDYNEIYDRA
ncbi:uncharacterized protein LOC115689034 [Syzygium oleosum]|uniref:uncharacterized protein LOC115689034 n=1 Tax=Syzygium oleosum TaxID=219896 RepID=UPI0011D28E2E|nr:uncharacterized protein LOC115689034 [Syzygium oleosum]